MLQYLFVLHMIGTILFWLPLEMYGEILIKLPLSILSVTSVVFLIFVAVIFLLWASLIGEIPEAYRVHLIGYMFFLLK
jgi:hypothetical protein